MVRKTLLPFLLLIAVCFSSCQNEGTDFSNYYEGKYNDEMLIVTGSDTVNIVLEQYWPETKYYNRSSVPYSVENLSTVSDLIRLKLFVSFGSYEQTPIVFKNASKVSDTLYLWYSAREKLSGSLNKSSYITEYNTSPKLPYVIIDSIVIQKGMNKSVNFLSWLFHF